MKKAYSANKSHRWKCTCRDTGRSLCYRKRRLFRTVELHCRPGRQLQLLSLRSDVSEERMNRLRRPHTQLYLPCPSTIDASTETIAQFNKLIKSKKCKVLPESEVASKSGSRAMARLCRRSKRPSSQRCWIEYKAETRSSDNRRRSSRTGSEVRFPRWRHFRRQKKTSAVSEQTTTSSSAPAQEEHDRLPPSPSPTADVHRALAPVLLY